MRTFFYRHRHSQHPSRLAWRQPDSFPIVETVGGDGSRHMQACEAARDPRNADNLAVARQRAGKRLDAMACRRLISPSDVATLKQAGITVTPGKDGETLSPVNGMSVYVNGTKEPRQIAIGSDTPFVTVQQIPGGVRITSGNAPDQSGAPVPPDIIEMVQPLSPEVRKFAFDRSFRVAALDERMAFEARGRQFFPNGVPAWAPQELIPQAYFNDPSVSSADKTRMYEKMRSMPLNITNASMQTVNLKELFRHPDMPKTWQEAFPQ